MTLRYLSSRMTSWDRNKLVYTDKICPHLLYRDHHQHRRPLCLVDCFCSLHEDCDSGPLKAVVIFVGFNKNAEMNLLGPEDFL